MYIERESEMHYHPLASPFHLRSLLSAGGWFFLWSFVVLFLSCVMWCCSCCVCVCDLFLFLVLTHPPPPFVY